MSSRQPHEVLATPPVPTDTTFDLTQDEKLLLSSYRATSDDGRYYSLGLAVDMAESCPRHKRPTLQLLRGGTA